MQTTFDRLAKNYSILTAHFDDFIIFCEEVLTRALWQGANDNSRQIFYFYEAEAGDSPNFERIDKQYPGAWEKAQFIIPTSNRKPGDLGYVDEEKAIQEAYEAIDAEYKACLTKTLTELLD